MESRERFESVVREVLEPLRRYLGRRTDPDTAEDVLAETLLVCWRRVEELPDEPLPWAYGVARHCLANAERGVRRRRRLAARVATLDPPPTTASPAAPNGDLEEVRDAMDRLPGNDRELLRLWAWEQLEPREIAVVLDTTANAVSIRLHRARGRLREELRKSGAAAGHEESTERGHG